LVLQSLHGLSDREALAALRTDLRWKVATGLPIGHAGFDPSTLTYWRKRLAASGDPHRIADAVLKVVAETGVLKGKNRRALDSTILDDAVATQDTVTQLIAIIRKVRREIPAAAAMVATKCSAHNYDDPGKPQIAWDDSEARAVLIDALVRDALALLAEVTTFTLTAEQNETVALLALIAGQDVEPAEGSDGTDGRWQITRKVAKDRVISVIDPDVRHAHKTVHRRASSSAANCRTPARPWTPSRSATATATRRSPPSPHRVARLPGGPTPGARPRRGPDLQQRGTGLGHLPSRQQNINRHPSAVRCSRATPPTTD